MPAHLAGGFHDAAREAGIVAFDSGEGGDLYRHRRQTKPHPTTQ